MKQYDVIVVGAGPAGGEVVLLNRSNRVLRQSDPVLFHFELRGVNG